MVAGFMQHAEEAEDGWSDRRNDYCSFKVFTGYHVFGFLHLPHYYCNLAGRIYKRCTRYVSGQGVWSDCPHYQQQEHF
jgi:hypothetical protein